MCSSQLRVVLYELLRTILPSSDDVRRTCKEQQRCQTPVHATSSHFLWRAHVQSCGFKGALKYPLLRRKRARASQPPPRICGKIHNNSHFVFTCYCCGIVYFRDYFFLVVCVCVFFVFVFSSPSTFFFLSTMPVNVIYLRAVFLFVVFFFLF